MKIDPSKIVDTRVDQNRRTQAESAQAAATPTASANPAAAGAKAASPAASLDINVAAAIANAKSVDKGTDVKLLDEIRSKIAAGEFEIDYDRVAESILNDAIASSMRRAR
ncbi:MAG: flagellar biosynthesis anti-sigma factor FlgM [Betaproteobacteria bacterium]|jgi:anti-sigma28 factor (negative regulator of flagellin synthesis)